jgi:macrolide-specific efflux system membrane fusion protein
MAEQSLADAQLTSPISGTIASVGLSVGATVGANSSSDAVVIVGTQSFEATSTLTSAQVVSVKVGQTAEVTVDGSSGSITGTVSQVGPVQVSSGTYSYPVVIALPASATGLFSGSSANISIFTSAANNVLAVPTSAVLASGTRTYVLVLSGGTSVEKTVKTGIVGNVYTQVLSGLQLGASVVLANDSQAVPASSATTLGGFGGFGGAGGGGRFNITQVGPGGGGGSGVTQIPVGG